MCVLPTLALCLLLLRIEYPGLVNVTDIPRPKIPICGSYFTSGMSMCSLIPNE